MKSTFPKLSLLTALLITSVVSMEKSDPTKLKDIANEVTKKLQELEEKKKAKEKKKNKNPAEIKNEMTKTKKELDSFDLEIEKITKDMDYNRNSIEYITKEIDELKSKKSQPIPEKYKKEFAITKHYQSIPTPDESGKTVLKIRKPLISQEDHEKAYKAVNESELKETYGGAIDNMIKEKIATIKAGEKRIDEQLKATQELKDKSAKLQSQYEQLQKELEALKKPK